MVTTPGYQLLLLLLVCAFCIQHIVIYTTHFNIRLNNSEISEVVPIKTGLPEQKVA
jgi:hypothetical protein